jgi:hypothetical protein
MNNLNQPLPPPVAEAVAVELIKQLVVIVSSNPRAFVERLTELHTKLEAIEQTRIAAREEHAAKEKDLAEEARRQAKLRAEADARLDRRETELTRREKVVEAAYARHAADQAHLEAARAAFDRQIAKMREFAGIAAS